MGNNEMRSQRSLTTERKRESWIRKVRGRGHKKSVKRIGFLGLWDLEGCVMRFKAHDSCWWRESFGVRGVWVECSIGQNVSVFGVTTHMIPHALHFQPFFFLFLFILLFFNFKLIMS